MGYVYEHGIEDDKMPIPPDLSRAMYFYDLCAQVLCVCACVCVCVCVCVCARARARMNIRLRVSDFSRISETSKTTPCAGGAWATCTITATAF